MKIFIYMRSVIKKILLVNKKKKKRRIDKQVKWKLIKGNNILKLKHVSQEKSPCFTSLLYNLHLHFTERTYKTSCLKCSLFP